MNITGQEKTREAKSNIKRRSIEKERPKTEVLARDRLKWHSPVDASSANRCWQQQMMVYNIALKLDFPISYCIYY